MSCAEPAETPTIPRKLACGYASRTAASWSSTSPTSPSRLNDGVASRAFAWPRRTKTHERQPRELAYFMSQRVCPAVPVIVCRNATIGASGGSAAPSGSFDHSTITSGCAVAE